MVNHTFPACSSPIPAPSLPKSQEPRTIRYPDGLIPCFASIPEAYSSSLRERCSDQEAISILRKHRSELEAEVRHGITGSAYPRHGITGEAYHPGWYLVWRAAMEGWKTNDGTWSPKKLVSIRNTYSPEFEFVGAKTTMEFNPTDGTKAVVGMTRYNLLTTRKEADGLDLDDELSLCHVFPLEGKGKGTRNRNGKRARSGYELDPRNGVTPLVMDDDGMNVQDPLYADPSKPKHWESFTKIYTKNPKLMYAACNHCDTMLKLKGGSSCGTGSLRHHNDSCRCKPKQEQLPGNSSSMPIQFSSVEAIEEYLCS